MSFFDGPSKPRQQVYFRRDDISGSISGYEDEARWYDYIPAAIFFPLATLIGSGLFILIIKAFP